ncbi:hypothetical protein SAMN00120144_0408 [Hymenobacter roseosalivarius DSM 11622]|uniref:Uncharacterized protein n=1 Tax=Hymenobacter roseosalivarius DSM 11622 TaxID=645990 RepID=A0A1W1VVX8_9BACT|nr:hypothetical protein SAMN00120144_0408 [Hymenobacter roseosalivarius DSM 11622]
MGQWVSNLLNSPLLAKTATYLVWIASLRSDNASNSVKVTVGDKRREVD